MKILSFFFLFCFFISCTRDNEEMFLPDPVITVHSPLNNSVIHPGDTIYIDAVATVTGDLHGYELAIRKPAGTNLYFQHYHEHNDTLVIKDKWKNTIQETTQLEVMLSIILDDEDHRKNVLIPLQVRN